MKDEDKRQRQDEEIQDTIFRIGHNHCKYDLTAAAGACTGPVLDCMFQQLTMGLRRNHGTLPLPDGLLIICGFWGSESHYLQLCIKW